MHRRRADFSRRRLAGPYPFLDAPRPLAFAHRGGAAFGDENTHKAFARAVAAGYRYIETDVHASADGVAVVFHDADLERLTGDARRVRDLSWSALRSIRHRGERLIPRLDEVLASWPEIRFNIDVKSDPAVPATLDVIAGAAAIDRVLVGSFEDRRLVEIRKSAGPRLATSMGTREAALLWGASRLPWRGRLWGFARGAAAVQVPLSRYGQRVVDARFVEQAHRVGVQVHVWTIDDPGIMNALLDLGVDGIMTDKIEILADVYRSRGLWPE